MMTETGKYSICGVIALAIQTSSWMGRNGDFAQRRELVRHRANGSASNEGCVWIISSSDEAKASKTPFDGLVPRVRTKKS